MKATQTLLEREQDLDLLCGALPEIGALGGRVVLVRGEAGIGKSALVREFLGPMRMRYMSCSGLVMIC